MTKNEFAGVMLYITAGTGKKLSDDSLTVYFDLLSDLPLEVLKLAAKKVMTEHVWASFPSIAELRQAAVIIVQGQCVRLPSVEAWRIAWNVIRNTDPEIENSFANACQNYKAPSIVVHVLKSLGILSLCFSREPTSVIRAQFTKAYENVSESLEKVIAIPAATRQAIAAIPGSQTVHQLTAKIGALQ